MATPFSILAWKIPWEEELGGLQSMGSQRVGRDRATSLSLFLFMRWRRKWQPTPVFLTGKFHGQRSLVGPSPWGWKELDTTEQLSVLACMRTRARTHTHTHTRARTHAQLSLGPRGL